MSPSAVQGVTGRLAGKVALVTGGASGIGLGIVERLIADGAQVAVFDINDPNAAIDHLGEAAFGLTVDVSDEASVVEAIAATVDHFGKLDILVNNAGVEGAVAPIADSPLSDFDRLVAVNLRGVFVMTKHAIPLLLKSDAPSVVNISSASAVKGTLGFAPYSSTKAAVITLTKVGAAEYAANGLRMNVILPGVIETPMSTALFADHPEFKETMVAQHPIGHLGQPSDIAAAVAFLASDDANFITGAELAVDGGLTAT